MEKIRFLHIVKDDKFFKPVQQSFEKEELITSEYIYYRWRQGIRYLNDADNLTIYEKKRDVKKRLQADDYDVVYLHSLHFSILPIIKYIPRDRIVIWWSWGGDIYDGQFMGLRSFVRLDVYKPETKKIIDKTRGVKNLIARILFTRLFDRYHRNVIDRVDFFQPVIDIDYELMKKFTGFTAKEFYPSTWSNSYTGDESCVEKNAGGGVILGNSASSANNHVDAWKAIRKYLPAGRKLIVPLSYGAVDYAKCVKREIEDHGFDICFLDKFLPPDEYFNLVGRCTYAVYGSIRQHAMGNIYNSLKNGVKVFLFEDSYVYKYLTRRGYVVFSLDKLDENSFKTPLSVEDHRRNLNAMKAELDYYRGKGKHALDSIKQRLA